MKGGLRVLIKRFIFGGGIEVDIMDFKLDDYYYNASGVAIAIEAGFTF